MIRNLTSPISSRSHFTVPGE